MYKNVLTILTLFLTFITLSAQEVLNPMQQLGKEIFFDNISNPHRQSCASCHAPETGFSGPSAGINLKSAVYPGAVATRFGDRKPPSAAYATLSPVFDFDEDEGLFIGGNFWDGRATGLVLGNPAADQALGPFLNPVEQNNPNKEAVLQHIAESKYADLWEEVWGIAIDYSSAENIDLNYNRVGLAIAEYEDSPEVNAFTSKYDYYLAGLVELNKKESLGLELFNDEEKGKCALCHISEPDQEGNPPLFTDYTFDNLGTPKNPDNPVYDQNPDYIDYGLGGFLQGLTASDGINDWAYWKSMATGNMGKHKVPTLRNVAKAPSENFTKAYMHNGVFKTLEEVVHFYNTRDVEDWPAPEVADNVNTEELGNLGLTHQEEIAIVAFMRTLSDGYDLEKDKVKDKTKETTLSVSGANPFNPVTRFTYSIQEAAKVKITVFNVIGKKVTVLVNGYQQPGSHNVQFDGSHLASGVYFIHLVTNNVVLTKKVSLLK